MKYTDKQRRHAEPIEKGYEHRGVGKTEAKRRAWATVNEQSGGGNKSGSGRGSADWLIGATNPDQVSAWPSYHHGG